MNEPITPPSIRQPTNKVTQAEALARWENKKGSLFLPTGLEPLDKALGGGLPVHQVTTCLGYTGSHKSEFARQLRRRLSLQGHYVLHLDVELGSERIIERDLAQESGISPTRLRQGHLTKEEFDGLTAAKERIRANKNVWTYNASNMGSTPAQLNVIKSDLKQLESEGMVKPALVILDSAQRLAMGVPVEGGGGSPRLQVQALLGLLEDFARQSLCAVYLISEQARAQEGGRPTINRLLTSGAESRAIEYVSDVLISLEPTEDASVMVAGDAGAVWEREVELIILKNRNGPLGLITQNLVFKAPIWDMELRPRQAKRKAQKAEEKNE